jgi:tetratricopeptide (TPR) repeat protein
MSSDPTPHAHREAPRTTLTRALFVLLLGGLLLLPGCYRDSESRLVEVRTLQEAGEFEASIEPIRVLLHTDPTNAEANYRLGVALVRTGRNGLAIWPLQKASRTEEYGVEAGLMLAGLLFKAEDYEEAVRTANEVLAIDPERAGALYVRAEANIGAGNPEAALEDAETLLALRPDDYEAYLIRAAAYIDLDQLDAAEAAHRDMLTAAEAMDNREVAARACALLASHIAGQEKQDEAEAQYRICLDAHPGHAMLLHYATNFYVDFDRADDAVTMWRESVANAPEDFTLRFALADLLVEQQRETEAEEVLQEAVDLFDTAAAWQTLSGFYKRRGDTTSARKALENAVDRTPGQPEALRFALADLLIAEGDIERAAELADQIREPAYKNLLMGSVRLQAGDPAGALEIFEVGLRLWPNNAGARFMAGSAAEQLGDLDRAAAEYREALRIDSKATDAALQLGAIHFELGEYGAAVQFAQRQIEERPLAGSKAHVLAVRAATAMGNHEGAHRLLDDLEKKEGTSVTSTVERAGLARATDGPEAAVALLRGAAIDLSATDSLPALRALTNDLVDLGRSAEALTGIAAAQKAQGETADLLDLRGRVELLSDDRTAATESFARVLEIDPEHGPALHAMSSIAAAEGRLEDARELARRSAAASTRNDSADGYYTAAQLSMLLGEREAGIGFLREAVRVRPGHVGAANDLAWELAERGTQLERALALAKLAARKGPSAHTLDTLGWVQLKRNEPSAAARAFEAALEFDADSPVMRYHLALALDALGEKERARELLKESLSAGEFAEREQAQLELARLEER